MIGLLQEVLIIILATAFCVKLSYVTVSRRHRARISDYFFLPIIGNSCDATRNASVLPGRTYRGRILHQIGEEGLNLFDRKRFEQSFWHERQI